jgi:hypothetical protein
MATTSGITAVNMFRRRGDHYPWQIQVKDETGTVVDVTGNTFRWVVDTDEAPSDGTGNVIDLAGVIASAAAGQVLFSPTSTQMNQTPGDFFYEIQMVDSAGKRRTIMTGDLTIDQDIAKGS